MRCLLFGIDHCILQLWFIYFSTFHQHARRKTTTNGPKVKQRTVLNQCQIHKMDEWYFSGPNPEFCCMQHTKCANVILTDLLSVILWAILHVCVCLMTAWTKCSHSSRHRARDRDLEGSTQNNVRFYFVLLTLRAACKTGACENTSAHFHLSHSHMPSLPLRL